MNGNVRSMVGNQTLKRPFGVTVLILAVLSIAVIHLVRFIQVIQQWGFLENWPGIPKLYLALTGIVWAIFSLPLAWGLWRGKPWAPAVSRLAIPAYLAYSWIDRIFIANRDVTLHADSSWPCMAGITFVCLIFVYGIFSRPKTKAFFRRD